MTVGMCRGRVGFCAGLAVWVLGGLCAVAAMGQQLGGAAAPQQAPAAQQGAAEATEPTLVPPPAVLAPTIPPTQLAFLTQFAGQPAKVLMKNQQFRAVMNKVVPNSLYHYGHDLPLVLAEELVLKDSEVPVEVAAGRFVTVAGSRKRAMHGRGLLWFDLETGQALGVFSFHPTNGEPTPTLTVFSKQLKDKTLSMGQLPPAFERKVVEWSDTEKIPTVTPRYFIPVNGRKYPLLHDEDYCANPPGMPAIPQTICAQMNADAAEADMDAAYFMKEAANTANATEWRIEQDQVLWLAYRQTTCGTGLPCRIEVTRRRTRELVSKPKRPQ